MIYLDNCSTTHTKPKSVIKAIKLGIGKYSINAGRGAYKRAIEAGLKVEELRDNLCKLFNFSKKENVIITHGCTESLNLALRGTIKPNGHIITTIFEHNSTLRTLSDLKKNFNITFTILKPDKFGHISAEKIRKNIREKTYLVAVNHTSNVVGATQNIESIGKICKKYNILFLVDSAQSAGHEIIDIEKCNINLLAVAGHKGLYGPQGIGALLYNKCKLRPIITGGTGTKSSSVIQPSLSPEAFESGTLPVLNILGLNEGIKFVLKNQKKINLKISKLTKLLIINLFKINNLKIFCYNINSGVVAINFNNSTSSELSDFLDKNFNIATRPGLHCAPLIHKYLNTTYTGLTRIGISYYNTKKDINILLKALQTFTKVNLK